MDGTEKVTRFEVIDHRKLEDGNVRGKVLTLYGVSVMLSKQDEGRTLKVFVTDNPEHSAAEVKQQIVAGLGDFVFPGPVEDFLHSMQDAAAEQVQRTQGGGHTGQS
jgi:hypothetical protein